MAIPDVDDPKLALYGLLAWNDTPGYDWFPTQPFLIVRHRLLPSGYVRRQVVTGFDQLKEAVRMIEDNRPEGLCE